MATSTPLTKTIIHLCRRVNIDAYFASYDRLAPEPAPILKITIYFHGSVDLSTLEMLSITLNTKLISVGCKCDEESVHPTLYIINPQSSSLPTD